MISFAILNYNFSTNIAGTMEDVVIMLPDQQISKILITAKQKSNIMSREKPLKNLRSNPHLLVTFREREISKILIMVKPVSNT